MYIYYGPTRDINSWESPDVIERRYHRWCCNEDPKTCEYNHGMPRKQAEFLYNQREYTKKILPELIGQPILITKIEQQHSGQIDSINIAFLDPKLQRKFKKTCLPLFGKTIAPRQHYIYKATPLNIAKLRLKRGY